jgi:hypothetical protein
MSNTFSDESIDVVFEGPDIPSLQSVDIMPSQARVSGIVVSRVRSHCALHTSVYNGKFTIICK